MSHFLSVPNMNFACWNVNQMSLLLKSVLVDCALTGQGTPSVRVATTIKTNQRLTELMLALQKVSVHSPRMKNINSYLAKDSFMLCLFFNKDKKIDCTI